MEGWLFDNRPNYKRDFAGQAQPRRPMNSVGAGRCRRFRLRSRSTERERSVLGTLTRVVTPLAIPTTDRCNILRGYDR
jgi:hypothetical protein